MLSTYSLLRNRYKQKFRNELSLFKNTKIYKDGKNEKLNLNDYDFVMSEPKHESEALLLSSKNYVEKVAFCQLFNATAEDIKSKIMKKRCNFACKYGRMICAVNTKTGKLDGGVMIFDLCDNKEFECGSFNKYDDEILDDLYKNIDKNKIPSELNKILFNDIQTENELKSIYGKYVEFGSTFVTNNNNKDIFFMLMWLSLILCDATKYKYGYCVPSHPLVKKVSNYAGFITLSEIKDIKNFKFKNGTNMKYHLNIYGKINGIKAMQRIENNLVYSITYGPIIEHNKIIKFAALWLIKFTKSSKL